MSYKNKHKNSNLNQNINEHEPSREHIVLPEVEVKKVKEPRPMCSICSEPIESIIEAISEPDGSYSHFDCVLNKLAKEHNVKDDEKISYVGQGCFAIFTKNEEGNFVIKEKISYENANAFDSMKKFVEGTKE